MIGALLDHAVLYTVGLLGLGTLAWALLRAWRRDPVLSYRLLACVAALALALPGAQWVASQRALGADTPLGAAARWLPASLLPSTLLARDAEPARPRHAVGRVVDRHAVPGVVLRPVRPVPTPEPATPGAVRFLVTALVAVYLIGLAFEALRLARRLAATLALLHRARPATDVRLLRAWESVSSGSRLARRIRLLECEGLDSPGCWGFVRPVILVPAGAAERRHREALECALLHELVHLERGDARVAMLEALLRSLLWFHPAMRWVCRELDRLREISCDLLVVRRTGRARSYALALLDHAFDASAPRGDHRNGREESAAGALAGPALAGTTLLHWSRSPSQIRRRIEMLTHTKDMDRSPVRGLVRWSAAAALIGTLGAGQLALASALPTSPATPVPAAARAALLARTDALLAAVELTPAAAADETIERLRAALADLERQIAELESQRDDDPLARIQARLDRIEAELAELRGGTAVTPGWHSIGGQGAVWVSTTTDGEVATAVTDDGPASVFWGRLEDDGRVAAIDVEATPNVLWGRVGSDGRVAAIDDVTENGRAPVAWATIRAGDDEDGPTVWRSTVVPTVIQSARNVAVTACEDAEVITTVDVVQPEVSTVIEGERAGWFLNTPRPTRYWSDGQGAMWGTVVTGADEDVTERRGAVWVYADDASPEADVLFLNDAAGGSAGGCGCTCSHPDVKKNEVRYLLRTSTDGAGSDCEGGTDAGAVYQFFTDEVPGVSTLIEYEPLEGGTTYTDVTTEGSEVGTGAYQLLFGADDESGGVYTIFVDTDRDGLPDERSAYERGALLFDDSQTEGQDGLFFLGGSTVRGFSYEAAEDCEAKKDGLF